MNHFRYFNIIIVIEFYQCGVYSFLDRVGRNICCGYAGVFYSIIIFFGIILFFGSFFRLSPISGEAHRSVLYNAVGVCYPYFLYGRTAKCTFRNNRAVEFYQFNTHIQSESKVSSEVYNRFGHCDDFQLVL